jgi:hypothetical protein
MIQAMCGPALILALALAPPGVATAAIAPPEALVRSLYREPSIPNTPAQVDRYFALDLAAAIKKDIAGGEVGDTNEADYRYDSQDPEITRLGFTSKPIIGGAMVTAHFYDHGHPNAVTYLLCERVADWRITDVRNQHLKMRALLKLPAGSVRC